MQSDAIIVSNPWYTIVMATTCYIGIDPGVSGGIAWIEGGRIKAIPIPDNRADVWQWFGSRQPWLVHPSSPIAMVEHVTGYVGGADRSPEGKVGRSGGAANGSRMFTFGMQYERVMMALCAAGIPTQDVTAQKWQRALNLQKWRGEMKGDHKRRIKEAAQVRYPTITVTSATADALMIATYLYLSETRQL